GQTARPPEEHQADVGQAVTIEVTVEQAQKITLAATVGELSLALRDVTNVDSDPVRTVSLGDLNISEALVTPDPPIVAAAEPEPAPTPEPEPDPVPAAAAPMPVAVTAPAEQFGSIGITRGLSREEYKINGAGQVVP